MRRRLAVTAVVVTALFGEWIGHGISYYRVAGVAGLEASLGGGVHDYMLPLAGALLAAAALGAAALVRAWLALGRRLDTSARLLARLRRGDLSAVPSPAGRRGRAAPPPASMPSPLAGVLALALPLATLQCAVYLVQENLERALRGIPAGGFGPLLDGGGAAMWIQAAVALALATILTAALVLIRRRHGAVQRLERLTQALWERSRSTSAPAGPRRHVTATQLLLGSALWQRPPPALSPA